jgi:glutathione synthase
MSRAHPTLRLCFLVADLRSQGPTYAGVHLGWAAHRRGHEVCFVSIDDLSFLDDNAILGTTTRARAGDYARPADYLAALQSAEAVREEEALARFDVVFLRYNPMVESGHVGSPVIDLCWRLRLGGTLVINDPEGVRRAGSGMYLADLPAEVRARTLVSRSSARLKEFLRGLDGPAVLRSMSPGAAGKVFYVRRRQKANVNQIITAITRGGYAVAQEFLAPGEQGEKRVLLLAGEPVRFGDNVAVYRRVPVLRGGLDDTVIETPGGRGRRKPCELSPAEVRLCEVLRPKLLSDGLYLATADIAGDKILGLDVFTPAGLHSLREVYKVDVADIVVRDVERRVRLRAAYRTTFDPEAADIV